jgi:hypothetical protein
MTETDSGKGEDPLKEFKKYFEMFSQASTIGAGLVSQDSRERVGARDAAFGYYDIVKGVKTNEAERAEVDDCELNAVSALFVQKTQEDTERHYTANKDGIIKGIAGLEGILFNIPVLTRDGKIIGNKNKKHDEIAKIQARLIGIEGVVQKVAKGEPLDEKSAELYSQWKTEYAADNAQKFAEDIGKNESELVKGLAAKAKFMIGLRHSEREKVAEYGFKALEKAKKEFDGLFDEKYTKRQYAEECLSAFAGYVQNENGDKGAISAATAVYEFASKAAEGKKE